MEVYAVGERSQFHHESGSGARIIPLVMTVDSRLNKREYLWQSLGYHTSNSC